VEGRSCRLARHWRRAGRADQAIEVLSEPGLALPPQRQTLSQNVMPDAVLSDAADGDLARRPSVCHVMPDPEPEVTRRARAATR
jgi:hypothetical protein